MVKTCRGQHLHSGHSRRSLRYIVKQAPRFPVDANCGQVTDVVSNEIKPKSQEIAIGDH